MYQPDTCLNKGPRAFVTHWQLSNYHVLLQSKFAMMIILVLLAWMVEQQEAKQYN